MPTKSQLKLSLNSSKSYLLIDSFVSTQQNNWIFITQVEAYYHDKYIDGVAQVDNKKDEYPQIQ